MADKAFRVRNGLELGNDKIYSSDGTGVITTNSGYVFVEPGVNLRLAGGNGNGIEDGTGSLVFTTETSATNLYSDSVYLMNSAQTHTHYEFGGSAVVIKSNNDDATLEAGGSGLLYLKGGEIRLRSSSNVDVLTWNENTDNFWIWKKGQVHTPVALVSQNRGTTFTVKAPGGSTNGEGNYQQFAINNAGSGTTNIDLSELDSQTGTWIITVKNNNTNTCSVQTVNGAYSHNVSSGHSFVLIVFVLNGYIQHVINPTPAVLITPSNA